MGHSLSLLTAALLMGQTPLPQSHGKNCSCNKATQGYIAAQPEYFSEAQPIGWFRRGTSSSATTSEWRSGAEWRSSNSEGSWIDNRPVLSRVKNWFGRGDNAPASMEPLPGQTVIIQPSATGQDYYRRLPTTNEPPLGGVPAQPVVRPERTAPSSPRPAPAAPPSEKPLTIEVEPIEFRPAGQAKGTAPAMVAPSPSSKAMESASARPNPISARFVSKVGQPGDYSWITGQLEVRNGTAILHYATPDTVDRYNGSLVLATSEANLRNVRSGDLVSVRGSIQQQGRGAVYRVQSIDLIER